MRSVSRRLALGIVLAGAAGALASCDTTVTPTEALPPLQAATADASAG